jgi:hypothetical protein
MKNIRIIKTNVDVSKILDNSNNIRKTGDLKKILKAPEQLDPTEYIVTVDVLQLIIGGLETEDQYVGNSEICIKTPAYEKHTEVINYLSKYFKKLRRCAFLALPVGEEVGFHIDEGTYYLTKDRYHLSIQGKYEYTVGDETVTIEPGTLFWFNNKLPHKAVNIGDNIRITFVFDVPHHKRNL